MTVCPSCGLRFHGNLRDGCANCGARSVGDPLVQPEHQLPFYGRALFVGSSGAALVLIFLAGTVGALLQADSISFKLWSIVGAAETAAWRLKWIGLPVAILLVWSGRRIFSTIQQSPERFAGVRIARGGVRASALVAIMMVGFIGVTIPARVRQHHRSLDAGHEAQLYTVNRALLEYLRRYETYPANIRDLKDTKRVPDPDGSIALALSGIEEEAYKPTAEMAFGNGAKSQAVSLRGGALRKASLESKADTIPPGGVTFTSYELRVPGDEYKTNPKDEWLIRDGIVVSPSQSTDHAGFSTSRTRTSP